jgi:hypothetical protein
MTPNPQPAPAERGTWIFSLPLPELRCPLCLKTRGHRSAFLVPNGRGVMLFRRVDECTACGYCKPAEILSEWRHDGEEGQS